MLSILSPMPPPPRCQAGHWGLPDENEEEEEAEAEDEPSLEGGAAIIPRDAWMTPYIFARLPACMFQGASLALGSCSHEDIENCIIGFSPCTSVETCCVCTSHGESSPCDASPSVLTIEALTWDDEAIYCASPPPEFVSTHPSVFMEHQPQEEARDFLAGVVPLGWCAVSVDPATGGIWEACNLILWQNCLFELSSGTKTNTLRQNNITGYAHLSEADVGLCGVTLNPGRPCKQKAPSNMSSLSSTDACVPFKSATFTAVSISYYTSCSEGAARRTIWLRSDSEEGTLALAGMLTRASKLTVPRLYSKSRMLGQGAFGEVFEAERRPMPWGGFLRSASSFGVPINGGDDDEDTTKKCALKVLNKSLFWSKVDIGQERSDAIVRETVTQLLAYLDAGAQFSSLVCSARSEREDCGLDLFWAPSRPEPPASSSPFDSPSSSPVGSSVLLAEEDSKPELASHAKASRYVPIVRLFRIFETRTEYVFELELMDAGRGDLASVVQKHGALGEAHAASIVIQLIIAASICHGRNVIHRDIKLQNVVFPRARVSAGKPDESCLSGRLLLGTHEVVSGPADGIENAYIDESDDVDLSFIKFEREQFTNDALRAAEYTARSHVPIKLADFGMADTVDAFARLTGRCGTLGYVAPEIILSDDCANYGYKVDMFSIGCLAFALLSGEEPFHGCDSSATLRANTQGTLRFDGPAWSRVSFAAQDWVMCATCPFEAQRMNLRQALSHSWLRNHLANWETAPNEMHYTE